MEKVPAILEKYEQSFRITPERPTKSNKGRRGFKKVKAELFHWEESDAMDIYICPPRDSTRAVTEVVKRWPWGGSVSRSIFGRYTIRMTDKDRTDRDYAQRDMVQNFREMLDWIEADKVTFKPLPITSKSKKR